MAIRLLLLLIVSLVLLLPVNLTYGAPKKDKNGKPDVQEEKVHNDMIKSKGLNISHPCLKMDKQKSRKENSDSIKACIDALPNK